MKTRPAVYIETSVISYLASKPSRDIIVAAHQQISHDWWLKVWQLYDPFISQAVIDEISLGDPEAVQKRLGITSGLPVLEINDEIFELAGEYFRALNIPQKKNADALHVAVATWHRVDYIATWNCSHIANARTIRILEAMNIKLGFETPGIHTPEELMEA